MLEEEKSKEEYKGGKLSETVIASLGPFLEKLCNKGIRKTIVDFVPGFDLDKFVIGKMKSQLSKHRVIELDNAYLRKLEIQYRENGIQIEPLGILRLLVKKITITDAQILKSFDSILCQIEEKYIKDNKYILGKIDEIVVSLSATGIYKPKNSKEKTLYDFAMLILLNYYKTSNKKVPKWINHAIENIGKGEFLNSWIEILIDYVSEMIADVSENIFVNFKVTFDSLMIRAVLNKKTNKGQISSLLGLLDLDIKKIIYSFAKSYVSPSFTKGIGEILADIASLFLSSADGNFSYENKFKENNLPFNITISIGKSPLNDRVFTWFTNENSGEGFLEYSYDENFENSVKIKSESKNVPKTFPFINFGLLAGYKEITLKKHRVVLKNLNSGKIYYKISSKNGKETEVYSFEIKKPNKKSEIIIFADSQGMIKQDYDIFSKVMDLALKDKKADFMVHLGDFVDDGNNEEFWTWLLSSKRWKENACIALAGNHEARTSSVAIKAGVENSIVGHFGLEDFPIQDVSKGIYYSFDYENATFLVLNTNSSEFGIDDLQYRYALDVLKNSKRKWKIILTHKSPYSNGPHCRDSDVKKIGSQVVRLAYEGGADVVFGGHDHVYVRTKVLSCDKNVGSEKFFENTSTYLNPYGTIFVVPGTSGVKNYTQNLKIGIPAEKMLDLKGPVYSRLTICESKLKFEAYLVDTESEKSEVIDSFSIEKSSKKKEEINGSYVSKLIAAIPDYPCQDDTEKIKNIISVYDSLGYQEKIKVKNSGYLFSSMKLRKNYMSMVGGQICRVSSKKEFLSAFKNSKVGTIITQGEEIKFGENPFKNSNLKVKRPICIRGHAKLLHISFTLQENSMLILCDDVCIDNTRKFGLICKSENIVELLDNSCLILSDNASINSFSGKGGKEKGIKVLGEDCNIYLGSASANFVKDGFLDAPNLNSKVIVKMGKYLSQSDTMILNCDLTINGGFIRNIRGLEKSDITVCGGIIGQKDNTKYPLPIKTSGKLILESGLIREKDGVSVQVFESGECTVKSKGDLSTLVDINGKILYN